MKPIIDFVFHVGLAVLSAGLLVSTVCLWLPPKKTWAFRLTVTGAVLAGAASLATAVLSAWEMTHG